MLHYLVLLGAAVNFYGIGMYIRDIWRGETKPNIALSISVYQKRLLPVSKKV